MNHTLRHRLNEYPDIACERLEELSKLIFQVAANLELGEVEQSLKWGELSFSVKTGSPIRIDWKRKTPDKYYMFFHCQTKLVDTFRELYADKLELQGNRAIVLDITKPLPVFIITKCIEVTFTYKQRKHLSLLGM